MATGKDLQAIKTSVSNFRKTHVQSQTEIIDENLYVMDSTKIASLIIPVGVTIINADTGATIVGDGTLGGTTSPVDGGAVTFSSVQLTGGTGTQGTMSWNSDEETIDVINNGSVNQLGQETVYHVG